MRLERYTHGWRVEAGGRSHAMDRAIDDVAAALGSRGLAPLDVRVLRVKNKDTAHGWGAMADVICETRVIAVDACADRLRALLDRSCCAPRDDADLPGGAA